MQQVNIEEFLPFIQMEVSECPKDVVLFQLKRALKDFTTETWAWNTWTDEDELLKDDTQLFLNVPNQSTAVGLIEARCDGSPYSLDNIIEMEGDVVVFAQPAEEDKTFTFNVALSPLHRAEYVPQWLFEKWGETIAHGCKWKLLNTVGQPWHDPKSASYQYKMFRQGISKAKAKKRFKGNTGRSNSVNPQTFV